ncbi:hypothetical protein [Saccharothrix texasensis]|uniref:Uncharacterized protein n=1 Tax=Saccharothrix texasensis TaxID=103734 RepID=A0A3N1HDP4_9PSEU|nr:hypothetical protein [Saccharothrix texasensis]ROP40422.1 hypothetical protein EDD40_5832 [Saccharothrix texasensis]
MSIPPPLLLLLVALALVAVIVLWKLLATAGLIGLTQWLVITQAENPTAVVVVVGVPALALAVLLRRLRRTDRGTSRSPLYLRRQEVSR